MRIEAEQIKKCLRFPTLCCSNFDEALSFPISTKVRPIFLQIKFERLSHPQAISSSRLEVPRICCITTSFASIKTIKYQASTDYDPFFQAPCPNLLAIRSKFVLFTLMRQTDCLCWAWRRWNWNSWKKSRLVSISFLSCWYTQKERLKYKYLRNKLHSKNGAVVY